MTPENVGGRESIPREDPLSVSVVIPTLNEAKNIRACLEALEGNRTERCSMEVVVVDAVSVDGTVGIVEEMSRQYPNIRLVRAEVANVAYQRNLGVQQSRGDIIVNFSGHAIAADNLVETLATKLASCGPEVAGVGCAERTWPGDSSEVALATNFVTRSALGGAVLRPYNLLETERYVNSVAFCAYRRELLLKVGLFDMDNPFGDDSELNLRLRKAGYKLLFTPSTYAYYIVRRTLRSFLLQMYRYGRSRMWILRKHGASVGPVYFAPLLLMVYAIVLLVGLFLNQAVAWIFLASVVAYLALIVVSSTNIALKQRKITLIGKIFLVYLAEHVGYEVGMAAGLLPRKRREQA